jgi:hypothetical protein
MNHAKQCYVLKGPFNNNILYQKDLLSPCKGKIKNSEVVDESGKIPKGARIVTYKGVFDVIDNAHKKLGYARDV